MKQSLRAKRMDKHHRRLGSGSKLNLVSLMDIFTILVFFLLVNSSDVEVLQTNDAIKLPESVAEQKPDNTLVIMASATDLLVNSQAVARVSDLLARPESEISELAQELQYQAKRAGPMNEAQQEKGRAVTIMGDAAIPYELLKKIMTTCATNEYRDISFAVSQVPAKNPEISVPDGTAPGPVTDLTGEG
ncbi:biopolymer transporter ExbD [Halioxenophilus sp. WMMB6]|uniref:ExbD/TolR family protein n=1 Tax=Halioxenophilus sp. WMMB6 TaxID=3073815 RepID=UPI00295ED96C|nr:biopolymer transporter ExbD [Halioxenophilus sp. WMMB6]